MRHLQQPSQVDELNVTWIPHYRDSVSIENLGKVIMALEILGPTSQYPVVRTSGDPYTRGQEYGRQAKARVRNTLGAYAELFDGYAGITWTQARDYASHYDLVISAFDSGLVAEMKGIAEGAGVDYLDILTINVRTEIMYGIGELRAAAECTAFVATPSATERGHTLLGQNWDWHPAALESCVILSIEDLERPSIVTVVEAGLLSKMGMNSAGLGVCTNAMVASIDKGEPGIPYHVMLRGIQYCRTLEEARTLITGSHRASSANYLVADASGNAADFEVAPGGPEHVFEIEAGSGTLGHANCFVSPECTITDLTASRKPLSVTRQRTIDEKLGAANPRVSVRGMQDTLAGHDHHPNSLCRHPLTEFKPIDRSATVASVIMDLTERRIWIADGQPCEHAYREFTAGNLWSGSSSGLAAS